MIAALAWAVATTALAQEGVPAIDPAGALAHGQTVYCRATRISPQRAITAAHCLYDVRRGALLDTRRLKFIGADGREVAVVAATHQPSWRLSRTQTAQLVASDIALLILAPQSRPRPLAAVNPRISDASCSPRAAASGVLELRCALSRGRSGEGVFRNGRLIGVVSTGHATQRRAYAASVDDRTVLELEARLAAFSPVS